MNIYKKYFLLIICVSLFSLCYQNGIKAEWSNTYWTPPYLLSGIDGSVIYDAISICADNAGSAHVFWGERKYDDEVTTINYVRFDGETWTHPNDIYVAPQWRSIQSLSAFVGYHDEIHLVWSEGNRGPVYYSKAPIIEAVSAINWSNPVEIQIPAFHTKLLVDTEGVLHLLYSVLTGDDRGVYYISSSTFGESWSSPVWLDPDIPPDYSPISVQFEIDKTDEIHALWEYADSSIPGFPGRWIRYAHSLDRGNQWTSPITIDIDDDYSGKLRVAGPVLSVDNQKVIVVWAGDRMHRKFRVSDDAGVSWKSPMSIFGELHGQARDDLIVDSDGRFHFLGQVRYPAGIYHSSLEGNRWSEPTMIYSIERDPAQPNYDPIHAHSVKAANPDENQLVIIFTNSPDESQIHLYAMHQNPTGISSPPATDSLPITLTVETTKVMNQMTPTETPQPTPEIGTEDASKTEVKSSQLSPVTGVMRGIFPVLFILAGYLVFYLTVNRKK
jgi:hypothetical protein